LEIGADGTAADDETNIRGTMDPEIPDADSGIGYTSALSDLIIDDSEGLLDILTIYGSGKIHPVRIGVVVTMHDSGTEANRTLTGYGILDVELGTYRTTFTVFPTPQQVSEGTDELLQSEIFFPQHIPGQQPGMPVHLTKGMGWSRRIFLNAIVGHDPVVDVIGG